MVYAASSLSLAALEKFVHLGEDAARIAFVFYRVRIPKRIRIVRLELDDMPRDWRDQPAPRSTRRLGDAWLAGRRSAVLAVPSVVTPSEFNFLFNPTHPDFARLEIDDSQLHSFDPRMWVKS